MFKRILVSVFLSLTIMSCNQKDAIQSKRQPAPPQKKLGAVQTIEGTINGGGGKGVLCKKNGKETIEVLDLYEAKTLYGLKIEHNLKTEAEAIEFLSQRTAKHFWNPISISKNELVDAHKKLIQSLLNSIKLTEPNQKIKLINDANEIVTEKNCEVVQIAAYYDESILLVDSTYWNQMDWTQKISLVAHELIYFFERQTGASNSIATRKFVGHLFSNKLPRSKADGVPKDSSQFSFCQLSLREEIPYAYFFAYNSEKNDFPHQAQGLEIVFTYILKGSAIFRTSMFLEGVDYKKIHDQDFSWNINSPIYVDTYSPVETMYLKFKGNGQGTAVVMNDKSGAMTETLKLSCDPIN